MRTVASPNGAPRPRPLDHPLTGAGADAYAVASVGHQPQPAGLYAHDLPLETWAELGPLGLALVCGLYVSVGALCWRIRRRPGAWLVVPGALAFLIANLVDWPWHLAGAGAVWALCVGGCLAVGTARRTSSSEGGGGSDRRAAQYLPSVELVTA